MIDNLFKEQNLINVIYIIQDKVVPASKVLTYIHNLKKESVDIIKDDIRKGGDIQKVFKNVAEYIVLIGY